MMSSTKRKTFVQVALGALGPLVNNYQQYWAILTGKRPSDSKLYQLQTEQAGIQSGKEESRL